MSTPEDRLSLVPLEEPQRRALQKQRLEVGNQLDYDPDRAMRAMAVGQETGLALELIDANLEDLEERLKKDRNFDPEAWKRESPGFADYAAENPYNLSVLKMDNENLTKWERNMRAISLSLDSTWAKVEANKINLRRQQGNEQPDDLERLAEYEKLLQPHAFAAESGWAKAIVWGAKEIGPMKYSIENAADEAMLGLAAGALLGGKLGLAASSPTGGVLAIPGLIAGGSTGAFVGWNVGLGHGSYDMITGESYGRYRRAGFTHENAAIAARAAGLAGAVAEPFGINMLFKYVPGARQLIGKGTQAVAEKLTGQVLARRTVKAATGKLLLRYGEVMGSEIAVEIYQDSMMTVGQNWLAKKEDMPEAHISREEWLDSMGETFTETAKAVLILAAFGPGLSYGGDFAQAKRANNLRTAYKALGESAKDSKLRKSVKAKYQEFVEKASGGVENMLIDIDRFTTYFQEAGLDPEKVAADLGISLEEARTFGTDMQIPIGVFADKIAASEHYDPLSMDFKTDLERMTGREAEKYLANLSELERAWALGEPPATHEPVQEIIDRIRNDLMANAGRDFSAASKEAALEEYKFSTAASKFPALTALDLFNRYFGGVQKEIDTTGERIDVNLRVDPLLDLLRAEKGPKQREIYGMTLVEMLTSKTGLQEQGGELGAMDAALEFPKLVQETGMTHDEAAEIAAEAGFIAERDPELLLEAIRNEIAGKPAFGRGADVAAQTRARELDELQDILDQSGLNVQAMTNAEIRKALAGAQTLHQDEILEFPGALPDRILEDQEFGDLQIVMELEIAGRPDEIVGISRSANAAYQTAVNRLRSMQDLLECLNAA